ncbi:MAG: hypothetical protein M1822_008386 [Bathelium mastoideum]|nr:MAG: hypothetical protein M1822_008386 [Bathelium mastoideum]
MRSQSVFAFATLVAAALALPGGTSPPACPTSSSSPTSATPTNNGQIFTNQCVNLGISIADCSQLANIALLNGDTVNIGGTAGPSAQNNGQEFLNQCANFGISILDCAQLLNIAALNGLTIDIAPTALISLLATLGIPTGILGGLGGSLTGTGLIPLPTGVV